MFIDLPVLEMIKKSMIKKSTKNTVFVFCLCYYNLLLIKFIVYALIVSGVVAVEEGKRQEIQRLRSELIEGLDNDNKHLAGENVIVQPLWTQTSDIPYQTDSGKVQVNAKNREEAAALRDEINQAVAADNHHTVGVVKAKEIKKLEASLSSTGKDVLQPLQSKPIELEEQVGAGLIQNEEREAPNIISANIIDISTIDIQKLQNLEISKRRTREVLLLKYIEEDFSFAFGAEVDEWKHIVHAGQEYFIGRRVTDLIIIRKDAAKYEQAMVLDIGHVITSIETYTYWNLEIEKHEGVIIIAARDKLLWYRANHETKRIELYWEWMVGNNITSLTHFTIDSKEYLTISSTQSVLVGSCALNIYQYKLESKELWIAQRLQLEYPFMEVTVLDSGRDIILAIPQNNTAVIYTFNPHEASFFQIRFELKKVLAAEGILTITGFQMGGRNYLALTGYQPQILLYQQGDFVSKTLLANNFGFVELFFPIPVRTYRDDLILLVQHKVDFTTHTLTVVETLIWDGEVFETTTPVPCHLGNQVVYGVGCMLDLQRDQGLKGVTLLKSGYDISIIVPRFKAQSGLFRLHTELLDKNSELLDLQEIFDFLKSWVKEQNDLIAQAEAFLQIPIEELIKYHPELTVLETLKTPEFIFNGEVENIYVNDYKWTLEDSNIDLELLIQNIEDLDRSLNSGRQRRNLDEAFHTELDFDEVLVDELELENLNGHTFFIQNSILTFNGIINLSQLEILKKTIALQKRQVNDKDFVLEGDLEFDKINGIEWTDIKNNLVFRTQKQNFVELEVKEEVFVENLLNIKTLNDLNFPDDYMLSHGPATSVVNVEKHFVNTLSVSSMDTNGLINGKNPADAITLTDVQKWIGNLTFKHLEVTEILELYGHLHGRKTDVFPQNPSLQETNTIEATCHFNELNVNGPTILKGEIDDQPLGALLKNIIKSQDPTEEILVPSLKSFDSVVFPVDFHLQNNTINQIPVNHFVTVNTEQYLNITSLAGYVYFYNLTLNGSYDGVKIENVLKEVIFLEKPIDLLTTELIFSEELKTSSISIIDTINQQPIKDNLQTLQEDLSVKNAEFEILQTPQADFSQDILGHGKLNNIELHSLVNERSWYAPPIRGNIFLNEFILDQGIYTDELDGIPAEYLFDFLNRIDELPDMVLNGKILVDHITVTGDVQLHKLNGLFFDKDVQLNALNLKHPNFLSTNLSFKNRVNIKGHLNAVGNYRGDYLPDIIDDIVVRSTNACIVIKAPKSFLKPVEVLQNTQVIALNGIPVRNLAWLSNENNFAGSVHLKGNLVVQDINVQGNINNLNWHDSQSLLYFNEELKKFVLKNTIEFKNTLFLEDLTVKGDLNDVSNLTDFFENLIYKNESCILKGKNTFTGRVSIEKGAYIGHLNGQDLMHLFSNLIFVNELRPIVIQAPVTFEDSIRANEVHVEKSLNVENISGCRINDWINESLRVDQDQDVPNYLKIAAGSLDGNSLLVYFMNDMDLSRIITLNTPQTFYGTINFSDIALSGYLSSKGLVNNLDLEAEFKNTFMTYGQQHIFSPLTIQSIVVLRDLSVHGPVNSNKDLQDVATLQEDLILESPLYFKSIYSSHVVMKDLITGIYFNKWFENAVKYHYSDVQYITGNWSTKYLKVKMEPTNFQYIINRFQPWQYYSSMRVPRSYNNEVYVHQNICPIIKDIWKHINKKSVLVKYIEEFNMNMGKAFQNSNETINKLFHLESNQENLLLINLKCHSYIYKWLAQENTFVYANSFESGPIDEIEIIPPIYNNTVELEFITNFAGAEKTNCTLKAINKWKVENNSIVLYGDLHQSSYSLYKSQKNSTSMWTLDNETIQELDFDYNTKQKWRLPVEQNKTRYRFVPLAEERDILLTNGGYLVFLSNNLENKLNQSSQGPQIFQFSHLKNPKDINSESLLKPNISVTHSFVFADIKHIIKRILIDLSKRLNQQINITQLSIPESDLLDEHLVSDFLSIRQELQKQNVYSTEVFNISFDKITLPETPAQVLAARVVQISWPVALEIGKIHSYLQTNSTHGHLLCSRITKSLGFLINDVLMLANEHNSFKDDEDHTLKLTSVIKRIRTLDRELEKFVKDIQYENKNLEKGRFEQSYTNEEFKKVFHNQDNLMIVENSHLPGYKQGEILSLLVGRTKNLRHLWAVTHTKASLTANYNNGIYLYLEGLQSQLYQVISATLPRSLQQLRIRQETFLLYIHDCCQVHILRYRGSQGFEHFSEINSKEYIKQILTITLPSYQGNLKHFVTLLFDKNFKFYEFVTIGSDIAAARAPVNCL